MAHPDIEWDVFQSYGRMPDNPNQNLAVPGRTWVAAAIHKTSRKLIAQSDPQTTEAEARADAERKLAALKNRST